MYSRTIGMEIKLLPKEDLLRLIHTFLKMYYYLISVRGRIYLL